MKFSSWKNMLAADRDTFNYEGEDMKKIGLVAVTAASVFVLAGCNIPGQKASSDDSSSEANNASGNGQGFRGGNGQYSGQRPQMDLSAAAEKLGVTEEALQKAMDAARQAAPTGAPEQMNNGQPPASGEFRGRMDLQTAADQLGVSVEDLQNALGFNGFRARGATPSAATGN